MPDYIDKLLAILFSFLILGQGYAVRRMVGTWLFPACLFALFWFAYTIIPLLMLFTVPFEPMAMGFILAGNLAFSLGSVGFNWKQAMLRNGEKDAASIACLSGPYMQKVFYGTAALAIIFVIISSAMNGLDLYSMIFNVYESAAMYTEKRYGEELDGNMFGRMATVLMYIAPTAGGLVYGDARSGLRKFLIVIVAASPSLFVMVTQSAKGALFLAMVMFYGSILLRKVYANDMELFKPGMLRQLTFYVLLLLPVLTVSFLARGLYDLDDNDFVYSSLKRYFASYTSGHLYAFSDWFIHYMGGVATQPYTDKYYTYGAYTFMSVYKALGNTVQFPIGVYDEYYTYKTLLQGNIYSIYRGLITDFSGAGALVYMYLTGLFLHYSYYRLLTQRVAPVACAVFICAMGYYYSSFIISLMMWNSIYVTAILIAAMISWNKMLVVARLRYRLPGKVDQRPHGVVTE